jgi:hypothetical protein
MNIEMQINAVKRKIVEMGNVRPGSISQQYNVCGKKECRCKDKKNPQKHGPYYILSYRFEGKNRTEYINPSYLPELKKLITNYAGMQKLLDRWIKLEIEKSKRDMADVVLKNR